MTRRARRGGALAIVLATLVALRVLVPDPVSRREAMLLVMVPLGYGHVVGALWFGGGRGGRAGRFAGFSFAVLGTLLVAMLVAEAVGLVMLALAALAVWHVFENESALAASSSSSRLVPIQRGLHLQAAPVLATAGVMGAALALPQLTRPLLRLGVSPGFAAWTAEELFAAVLYYHVVAWLLHAARPDRTPVLLAIHAIPWAVAGGLALAPSAQAVALAPLPYLVLSVAHALHTAWERGIEPRS